MTRTLDADGLVVGMTDAIFTFSGGLIQPLHPDPTDIRIEDIAHALSQQCRFTGHTRRFYSVAEHCLLCAAYVAEREGSAQTQLTALLHDASEAYLSDIARPVKKAPGFAETYLKFEKGLERAIGEAFQIPADPFSVRLVKEADERILGIEVHTLLPERFRDAFGEVKPWGTHLQPLCLTPKTAEEMFLDRFNILDSGLAL